jgi:hypothetical protein
MSVESNCFAQEFAIVSQLHASDSRSRCVDAFALALLKAERQSRRIFTYLVYQADCFDRSNVAELRKTLAVHREFDFSSALAGIQMLSPMSLPHLIGPEYDNLIRLLARAKKVRNKLFHGLVTTEGVDRGALQKLTEGVVNWSSSLATSSQLQLGYDGFNLLSSYTKHTNVEFGSTIKLKVTSIDAFKDMVVKAHREGKHLLDSP